MNNTKTYSTWLINLATTNTAMAVAASNIIFKARKKITRVKFLLVIMVHTPVISSCSKTNTNDVVIPSAAEKILLHMLEV